MAMTALFIEWRTRFLLPCRSRSMRARYGSKYGVGQRLILHGEVCHDVPAGRADPFVVGLNPLLGFCAGKGELPT